MTNQIVEQDVGSRIESVVIGGDLSKLTPGQRVQYYQAVCRSVGLNPLTRPFDYITLNGKLTLYARKDATDQLRNNNAVSIGKPDIQFEGDWIIVTVVATDKNGRSDSDIGVVSKKDMRGDFGNALMKAVTKAKRRVTLSICGLGMLDETEVETIPEAHVISAEVVEAQEQLPKPEPQPEKTNGDHFNPIQVVIDLGYASQNNHAANIVNASPVVKGNMTKEQFVEWLKIRQAWRDTGKDSTEAAERATKGEVPN